MKRLWLLAFVLAGCSAPPATPHPVTDSIPSLVTQEPHKAPAGFVWIPGGSFHMGKTDGLADAQPVHVVSLDGFWISKTEVTNSQFAKFIQATGYVTTAEKAPRPEDFPDANPELLVPGALVFSGRKWHYRPGADWRHPTGLNSDIGGLANHPVVNVSYEDALAYCQWAGGTLPTEAQFEYAERGGLEGREFAWGDIQNPDGKEMANIWQGEFPAKNLKRDGFLGTAPVGAFPPNGYGLSDMSGNVWEWCLDWYDETYYARSPGRNPVNTEKPISPEPSRVTRGGSFLCSDNYCLGYRPGARMKTTPDTGLFHTGFRCVVNP